MRSWKFWPGYLRSNPRYGTRALGPVGWARWKTGSYKLRNIGIGLVVFVGANLMVQRCFALEAPGLEKHTLGKRKDTRGNKSIANKL